MGNKTEPKTPTNVIMYKYKFSLNNGTKTTNNKKMIVDRKNNSIFTTKTFENISETFFLSSLLTEISRLHPRWPEP